MDLSTLDATPYIYQGAAQFLQDLVLAQVNLTKVHPQATFTCRYEDQNGPVLVLESRYGHKALVGFDWPAALEVVAELVTLGQEPAVLAASFDTYMRFAEPMQKVTQYLRVAPKTEPAAE